MLFEALLEDWMVGALKLMGERIFPHKLQSALLVGWMVGWMVGCMDGWLDGWMVGWLDGKRREERGEKTIYKNVGSPQTPDKPALLAQC